MKKILNTIVILVATASLMYYFFPPHKWLVNRAARSVEVSQISVYNEEEPAEFSTGALLKAQSLPHYSVGYVAVPSANIALPILEGVGGTNMLVGAGEQHPRTRVSPGGKGNYILASHHTDLAGLLFTDLPKTRVGSEIIVADKEKMYKYKVTNFFKTHVNDNSALEDTETSKITLYTCTDINSVYRWVVEGELLETKPLDAISPNEESLLTDWISVLR